MVAAPTPPAAKPATPDLAFHPVELWRIVQRRSWPALTVIVLSLGASAVGTLSMTKEYRATSSVNIERQTPRTGTLQDISLDTFNQEYYQTQYRILQSRTLAQRTVEKLNLAARPDFNTKRGPVEEFARRLSISPVRNSRIVNVEFEHTEPKLAAEVVNTLVKEYIADSLARRVASIREINRQLQKESDELLKKLDDSERALQKYNEEHQLATADSKQNITTKRLDDAITALSKAEEELSRIQALRDQVSKGSGDVERLFSLKGVLDSKVVQDLVLEENRIKQELADLSKRFRTRHPLVAAQEARLEDVRKAVRLEVAKIVAGIESQVEEAAARVEGAKGALHARKQEKLDLDRTIAEADVLRRTRDATKSLYDNLLQRIKESEVSSSLEINNITVVDEAIPPKKPSKPDWPLNLGLGMSAGLLLAFGLISLLERIDVRVKSADEVERLLGLPLVGLVPTVGEKEGAPETITHREPKSAAAEAFRAIRTALLLSPRGGATPRKVLLTSSGPNEGKTCSATNLAVALAQAGHRTLLIDADFHRPQLHKHLGTSNERGLSDSLVADGAIETFAQSTSAPNLWLLPTGPTPPAPAELLGSERMKTRLAEAGEKFDRIVIDTPPVCAVTDACVVAPHVDAVLFVVQPGLTERGGARRSLEVLSGVGTRPLGVILNRVTPGGDGYYRYYSYYKK